MGSGPRARLGFEQTGVRIEQMCEGFLDQVYGMDGDIPSHQVNG